MRTAALFRYPVKGFTREECGSLDVLSDGRIAGDRVLGLRFNGTPTADDAWGTKLEFVALVNTPGLTRLKLSFNHETRRLRIELKGEILVDDVLDDAGRKRFASVMEQYILTLDENQLSLHLDRLPQRVVGDGITPRYQDQEPGYVTLHGRPSLAVLATAVAEVPELSEHRFRSNIAVEDLDAWEEQSWIGRSLRIGDIEFKAVCSKTRCLATHANALTGERDLPIMKKLLELFPRERPTFAIAMTTDRAGTIRVGDKVELND
jgi:uncharacterized protein YcbX